MKRLLLCFALFGAAICRAESSADRSADSLLRNGDWFALDRLLAETETALSPAMRLRLQAMTDARFRRFDASNEAIGALLDDPRTAPEWLGELVGQLLSNYRMARNHAEAADLYAQLRQQDPSPENQAAHDRIQGFFAVQAALPPMRLERPAEAVEIPFRLDSAGRGRLLHIDARINGRTAPFVIDTGCAEMSFASEEFAREHGIRPLDYELTLSGVSGSQPSRLGVADSLHIGPMTLYNTVFVISDAPMIGSTYRIDAVLGCNFLFEAGVIEVLGAQRLLRFPAADEPAEQGLPNMYMDNNGLCYVRAEADGHPVLMQFDSGNTKSTLSDVYFDKYRAEIEATSTEREFRTGGIGGTQESRAYVKPAVAIGIDGLRCPLYDVEISYATQLAHERGEDGSLGVDFLLAGDRVRIDYDAMRITLPDGDVREILRTTPRPAQSVPVCDRRSTSVWESKNHRAAVNIDVHPAAR